MLKHAQTVKLLEGTFPVDIFERWCGGFRLGYEAKVVVNGKTKYFYAGEHTTSMQLEIDEYLQKELGGQRDKSKNGTEQFPKERGVMNFPLAA